MSTIGQAWLDDDLDGYIDSSGGLGPCQYRHEERDASGEFLNEWRGSPISTVKVAKAFTHEGRAHNLAAGTPVGCQDCIYGPRDN